MQTRESQYECPSFASKSVCNGIYSQKHPTFYIVPCHLSQLPPLLSFQTCARSVRAVNKTFSLSLPAFWVMLANPKWLLFLPRQTVHFEKLGIKKFGK